MEAVTAFAPSHITGFFQIFDQSADAVRNGSKGAGVSLDLGVKTTVKVRRGSTNNLKVNINNRLANSALVSRRVVKIFLSRLGDTNSFEILVDHHVEAPIGAGFGTSGAAALSLALALNEASGLGISRIEAAQMAHIAEVECKTGLGTIIAETFGGFEVRVKAGAPGIGEINVLSVPDDTLVACHFFGPLSTKESLTNTETRARINRLGGKLVKELIDAPTITNFMKLSRQFAEHVGLITEKVRSVLNAADKAGVACSMPMFGESVFAVTDREGVRQILQVFRKSALSGQTIVSKVNHDGARLLG